MFSAPETRNETFRDFLTAQELGIRGFPALIAGSRAKGYALITNGYRPLEDLLEPLERWLAAGAPIPHRPEGGAAMTDLLAPYQLLAYNSARQSENKMHDDGVARQFGFGGGLVPGVDVYAYMAHPAVARWGRSFLRRAR